MRIQSLRDLHLFFPDIDGFWNPHNLDESERLIRAELPIGKSVISVCQIEAVSQAVRLFCLQGKMKEAKNFLGFVEQYLKDLRSTEIQRLKTRFFLEEGRYYNLSMNPVKAAESFRSAWSLVGNEKKLDYLAIDAAFMISITLPIKQGKNWFKMALEMAEKSDNGSLASRWRCYLYMQAGWQSFDSHDFSSSLSYFEKAQVCCDKENLPMTRTLRWCYARIKRAIGHVDSALDIQKKILAEMSETIDEQGFVYLEIAECYQAKQDFEKSAIYYEKAYEKLKNNLWYADNYGDVLKEILKKSKQRKYH